MGVNITKALEFTSSVDSVSPFSGFHGKQSQPGAHTCLLSNRYLPMNTLTPLAYVLLSLRLSIKC